MAVSCSLALVTGARDLRPVGRGETASGDDAPPPRGSVQSIRVHACARPGARSRTRKCVTRRIRARSGSAGAHRADSRAPFEWHRRVRAPGERSVSDARVPGAPVDSRCAVRQRKRRTCRGCGGQLRTFPPLRNARDSRYEPGLFRFSLTALISISDELRLRKIRNLLVVFLMCMTRKNFSKVRAQM